tara:strand:+ start:5002 stop:5682 length:681 start_codon:yes stop_codon:yes gene_type:complete
MTIKLTGSNSGSVSLEAPATASGDISLTLPDSTGTAGQVLATDGTGALSFAASGGLKVKQYRLQYFVGNTVGGAGIGQYYSVGSGNNGSITTYESWKDITAAGSGSSLNMSIDSGYKFVFPETGLYMIQMKYGWFIESGQYAEGFIATTEDDYATVIQKASSHIVENEGSASAYLVGYDQCLFNVTNTSTHKVTIALVSVSANSTLRGDYSHAYTGLTFLRLGESV